MRHDFRLPRIERMPDPTIEEDASAHGWAVSYADLLMVLLSFFVIFFSVEPNLKENIIQKIASKGALDSGTSNSSRGSSGTEVSPVEKYKADLTQYLGTSLNYYNVTVNTQSHSLDIVLPDNLYAPGQFQVKGLQREHLNYVFKMLTPYADQLDIYFVGHSDQKQISPKSKIITNNFVLSSLRATSALEYAIKTGLSPKRLFAQGSAENDRNSRSLSIRIRIRGTQ